jgi:hydroxymethylbilane synthase
LIESVRGNVDTRLRKLDEGQYDALMLASAGLDRLGFDGRIAERVAVEASCPAVGQGALAVETRGDGAAYELVTRLNHQDTAVAVRAERAALAEMGGGCQVPLGAHATLQDGNKLHIVGVVVRPDGQRLIRRERTGPAADPEALGRALAADLLNAGGREILAEVYGVVDHP